MTDYTSASEDQLAIGMRAAHRDAYREFFARFSPLLMHQAMRMGVPEGHRWTTVTELLDDVAERLRTHRLTTRRPLAAYLGAALRRRVSNANRDQRNRERLEDQVASEIDGLDQVAVLALSSSHALRAIRPVDAEGDTLNTAVLTLGVMLQAELSDEERRLVAWLAERIPQREIAAWMGTTHGALRVRVSRLRRRLAVVATGFERSLEGAERVAVSRLLRRSGVAGTDVMAAGREHSAEASTDERPTDA